MPTCDPSARFLTPSSLTTLAYRQLVRQRTPDVRVLDIASFRIFDHIFFSNTHHHEIGKKYTRKFLLLSVCIEVFSLMVDP